MSWFGTRTSSPPSVSSTVAALSRRLIVPLTPATSTRSPIRKALPTSDDPGGVLTLPDGAISIPIYEEEVVVTKRVVLKERIVIRKRIETHTERVEAELRRERIELDVDEGLEDRVRVVDE